MDYLTFNRGTHTLTKRPRPLIKIFTGNIPPADGSPGISSSAKTCIQSAAKITCSSKSWIYSSAFGSLSSGSRIISEPN